MYREEKKCKNPECDSLLSNTENPKKIFCNNSCKSRYHYLKDLEENEEIIWIEKALRTNYKIIVNFIRKGIYVINADVIKALGFNRRVYIDSEEKFCNGIGLEYFRRIKDVFFRYDIIGNNIIIYN
jgi:hypothetical protein